MRTIHGFGHKLKTANVYLKIPTVQKDYFDGFAVFVITVVCFSPGFFPSHLKKMYLFIYLLSLCFHFRHEEGKGDLTKKKRRDSFRLLC